MKTKPTKATKIPRKAKLRAQEVIEKPGKDKAFRKKLMEKWRKCVEYIRVHEPEVYAECFAEDETRKVARRKGKKEKV